MTFDEMVQLNRHVVAAFDAVEQRLWTVEAVTIELSKQMGDLARRVMQAEGYWIGRKAHQL